MVCIVPILLYLQIFRIWMFLSHECFFTRNISIFYFPEGYFSPRHTHDMCIHWKIAFAVYICPNPGYIDPIFPNSGRYSKFGPAGTHCNFTCCATNVSNLSKLDAFWHIRLSLSGKNRFRYIYRSDIYVLI